LHAHDPNQAEPVMALKLRQQPPDFDACDSSITVMPMAVSAPSTERSPASRPRLYSTASVFDGTNARIHWMT
jgi:hypothetical protein